MPVMPQDRIALDRASARTIDQDGHLHVAESNISRAAVNGYLGREIPDSAALGLQPDKLYQLLRDPAELEKSAASFNGKPLLITHKPQSAADHDHELTVGAVNNVRWKAPFLTGELAVWDAAAIAGISNGEQKELSSAYRYKADMTPGSYQGVHYDGVMRDIVANHVALVGSGRAGSDVVVGDAALQPEELAHMATKPPAVLSRKALLASGALRAYLRPKLAQDAKIDLRPIMLGVTAKTWAADKARIKLGLDAAVAKGKLLAKDADIADVKELLDQLDDAVDDVADETDPAVAAKKPDDEDALVVDEVGLSPEEEAQFQALSKRRKADAAQDETPEAKAAAAKEAAEKAAREKNMITKPAMDAAIAVAVSRASANTEAATIARMRSIQEAERAVRPFIGELVVAQDSAAAVYKLALDANQVDLEGVPEAAYAALVKMLRKPEEAARAARTPHVAMDAANAKKFAERFPNADRLQKH